MEKKREKYNIIGKLIFEDDYINGKRPIEKGKIYLQRRQSIIEEE